jgi:hypothetical protein
MMPARCWRRRAEPARARPAEAATLPGDVYRTLSGDGYRDLPDPKDVMTTRAGLTLLIVGIILLFAVHVHIGFISLAVAGAICVAAAVLGWGLPRYRPGWTGRQRARLGEWLDPDPEAGGGARVPLTDILATPAAAPAAVPVAAPQPPAADVTGPGLFPGTDVAGSPPAPPRAPARAPGPPVAGWDPDQPTWPGTDDPPTQPDIPAVPAGTAKDDPDHAGPGLHAPGRHAAGRRLSRAGLRT